MRANENRRPGATAVEAMFTVSVFLVIVVGLLDLSLAGFRHHALQAATDRLARQAAVRGSLADAPWGPNAFGPLFADADHEIARETAPFLVGMDPGGVEITLDWPDGGNERTQWVRVHMRAIYRPALFSLFGAEIPLQASTAVFIAH